MTDDLIFSPEMFRKFLDDISDCQWFMLADAKTNGFCVTIARKLHPELSKANLIVIPDGESNKNIDSCEMIWNALWHHQADRRAVLFNIGGGMICDTGGFAASLYKRGIRFVHIPTTLLAMTDAAYGGKCGVNFRQTKNCLGVFQSAEKVYVNPVFLHTLPETNLRSGIAEMLKHALLQGNETLEKVLALQASDFYQLDRIKASIEFKSRIVACDPNDNDLRQILNLGHSVGHAIESHSMNLPVALFHGEAVMLGLIVEMILSHSIFGLPLHYAEQLWQFKQKIFPDLRFHFHWQDLQHYLINDKKNDHGLRMSLLAAIGDCRWQVNVSSAQVEEALNIANAFTAKS